MCGSRFPLPDGNATECDADGERPCCSIYGWCDNTTLHCTCEGCVDYRDVKKWRENGRKFSRAVFEYKMNHSNLKWLLGIMALDH